MKKLLVPALAAALLGAGCAVTSDATSSSAASSTARSEGEVLTGSRLKRSADENVYGTRSTERDKYDPNATVGAGRGSGALPNN